jgi:hypothetical protein
VGILSNPYGARGRYVISAQQVTLTIANGSASNTATINRVDPTTSFIVPGGWVASNANGQNATGYLQLTNGTTVTATRDSGGATGTLTFYCTVLYCSRRLVKSVQQGTMSGSTGKGGGSLTLSATINAVTVANAVAINLGWTNVDNVAPGIGTDWLNLFLNTATQVEGIVIGGGNNDPYTQGYVVVEFQPRTVTNRQQINITNTTTSTSLSPNIDLNRSVLFYGGFGTSGTTTGAAYFGNGAYNSTGSAITTTSNTATSSKYFTSIEFAQGILRSVQRGTNALSGATSGTTTIPFVDPNYSYCHQLGFTTTGTTYPTQLTGTFISNNTTIQTNLNSAGTSTASWEAVWFN